MAENILHESDWFFVIQRNERVRSYWHEKMQSISCRVRITKKGNAPNFRKNIIHYLYNRNYDELKKVQEKLNKEDWNLIQKKFGFDQLKFIEDEQKRKKIQFETSQIVRVLTVPEVIQNLELNHVVSVKISGYLKELFFLRCFIYSNHTQFTLRSLYHLKTNDNWMPEIDDYKEEIRYEY